MPKFVTPVDNAAVAEVRREVEAVFGSVVPVVEALSPAPELLVPAWNLLRGRERALVDGDPGSPGAVVALHFFGRMAAVLLDDPGAVAKAPAIEHWPEDGTPLRDAALLGGHLLTEPAREAVHEAVTRGVPLPGDLPPADRRGAALAVLAARDPERITEDEVAAWRGDTYTDHCLVHLFAFGVITAVEADRAPS
ncbi:hypothetical protein GCM10010492_06270 [Saccharothrix mutabilis subsp. mutabilis]|uniref:DNA-binding protein n=1 Tax=Saccharothrix mutabilis subsp. mutabilis TaxID=66855 RepID=A0ABN0T3B6_9PSEU